MPSTARLSLRPVTMADLADLYAIYADPATFEHYPSHRFTSKSQMTRLLEAWINNTQRHGSPTYAVRLHGDDTVLGNVCCTVHKDTMWNVGYRLTPAAQGQGLATEGTLAAVAAAREIRSDLPIVAYVVEHNVASARVAEKIGLTLQYRAPDIGNPDPAAIRLIYADRQLEQSTIAALLG